MYISIMGQKSKRRLPGLKWRSPRIKNITDEYAPRYVAIKLLEDDRIMKEQLVTVPNYACMLEVAQKEIQRTEKNIRKIPGRSSRT